ncbi:hypothetical protein K491DRAFT_672702 [Lophiostoma macrostomum CBS 122681]|uniref:DUF6594 domain-containing protein n=1 Tax=Lophiostoma macrostomum CBS 122681 TaxID=1314788 RepID=A0A6A6TVG3_9PLEO|nr:hypothetical protein K491DRAFT_672702 [Lophiostoma macrostomum CBS 122681]
MSQREHADYTSFYEDIALYPEVGRFRRFGELLAKKLYDDIEDVEDRIKVVNGALATCKSTPGISGSTILEVHRSEIKDCEEIKEPWDAYESALMGYFKTLCLGERVLKLPHQPPYAREYLGISRVFVGPPEDEVFAPTGEDASIYRGASHLTDTCSLRVPPEAEFVTTFVRNHAIWIDEKILDRIRACFSRRSRSQGRERRHYQHHRIAAAMDVVTCIIPSVLFTAVMFLLVAIGPLKARIGTIGGFGLAFSIAVKWIAGHPTRGEVFGATAGFFAVAAVFVSNSSNNTICQ